MSKVQIVEVGMRDGLQNEVNLLSQKQRYEFAKRLAKTGLERIEAGAFVSPKWVPQMANSPRLLKQLITAQKNKNFSAKIRWSALVPNMIGYQQSREAGVKDIAIFGAVSETFSKKNINASVTQSLQKFSEVVAQAKKDKVKVRGYVSTAFGCPYEGKISVAKAMRVIEKFFDLGIYELSVGDTIGVATPKQVSELLKEIKTSGWIPKTAMHFHDTRGTAIANISKSLEFGITVFDSSLGGLGGCPYAPGAAGNVATGDVVYLLEGMGYRTGVDLDELAKTTQWMSQLVGRPLKGPRAPYRFGMRRAGRF
jgi:hydroxymethylglutaryl-CoA lyase